MTPVFFYEDYRSIRTRTYVLTARAKKIRTYICSGFIGRLIASQLSSLASGWVEKEI